MRRLVTLFVIFISLTLAEEFGGTYDWQPDLDTALKKAAQEHKPVMVIIWTKWCPKCKALKPKFSDEKLQELAKKFIVVNVDSDAVKLPEKLSPDGSYIPRIIFLNDEGDLLPVVNESGNPKFKYFYTDPATIISSMENALKVFAEHHHHDAQDHDHHHHHHEL